MFKETRTTKSKWDFFFLFEMGIMAQGREKITVQNIFSPETTN